MSARITQSIAEMVTSKLLEKKTKEMESALTDYEKAVKAAYMDSIPKSVVALWKTHPEWLSSTTSITVDGNGFSRSSVNLRGQLPISNKGYYGQDFKPTKEQAKPLIELKNRYDKLRENRKRLNGELYATLLSCVTYKKAIEAFPEAKKYLPDSGLAMAVNAEKLREELKEIPTPL